MTDTSITAKLLSGAAHATPADPAATEAQPDPDLRILASIKKATGKQLLKEQKLTRERDKAIAANLSNALGVLEGETLRDFFAGLEGLATASQRKLIATHPLRPERVDEIIEKVDAERAKDTEAAKAEREAQRQRKEREEFERLKQKFEAGGGNAASKAKSDE